jgi:hypothetical protein
MNTTRQHSADHRFAGGLHSGKPSRILIFKGNFKKRAPGWKAWGRNPPKEEVEETAFTVATFLLHCNLF